MHLTDIFLSYNREDAVTARRFADAFSAEGFRVWWDAALRSGEAYDEVTEAALRAAKAVVVLWSPRSVISRWVRAEATIADRCKTLVPVMIEACQRPIMFELTQTADLSHWTGNVRDKEWLGFLSDVRRMIEAAKAPLPQALPQPPHSQAMTAERKIVSILFADIKDWLNRQDNIDPEDALAITEPVITFMREVVERYDGHVFRVNEDGLLALFGAPLAQEDHAKCALHAALAVRDEIERRLPGCGSDGDHPEVRVGISTGEVVVRTRRAPNGELSATPSGPVVSLASRLQAGAPPHAIVISAPVARLTEGYFELRPLADGTFEVLGYGSQHSRLERAAVRGFTHFCGRKAHLEAIATAAARSRASRGQIVGVVAEPGAGKSRLFLEFKSANAVDWTIVTAMAFSHGKSSAYSPIIALLEDYFGIAQIDNAPARREKIAACVDALDPALASVVPFLNGLLGVPDRPDPLADLSAIERRRGIHDAIKRLLIRQSLANPLMIIVEDLHWIDLATQEVLDLIAGSVGAARVLMLVNYRPEYSDPWRGRSYHTSLRLDGLSGDSADAMLSMLLDGGSDLEPLRRLIIDRTEGNPLFMEETVRTMIDEGVLEVGDTIRLARPLTGLTIPPTVQAILAARIDRLPDELKALLQTLAVLGRSFRLSLAIAVTGLTEMDLGLMLSSLEQEEFIYEQPCLGEIEYTFKHALTHDVAFATLLIEQRRALHLRTASALESLIAETTGEHTVDLADVNLTLAYHLEEAGDRARSAEYLQREAGRVFAFGLVEQAIYLGLRAICLAGADLPSEPQQIEHTIGMELQNITAMLAGRQPRDLADLPLLDDASVEQRILLSLTTAPYAFQGERLDLFTLLVLTALKLTLEHGQGPLAPDVYAMYSIVFGSLNDDRAQAAAWSQLGLDLQSHVKGAGHSRCAFIHCWFHNHWIAPLEEGIALAESGADAGFADGELLYGCFNLSAGLVYENAAGRPLADVMASGRARLQRNGRQVRNAFFTSLLEYQFAKAMAGLTPHICHLGDDEFDEANDINWIMDSGFSNQIGYYLVVRAKLHLHAGDWATALGWAAQAMEVAPYFSGQTAEFELVQYRGLAALAQVLFDNTGKVTGMIEIGRDCIDKLRRWSRLNPALFAHKADLLEGVLMAAEGRDADCERLLHQAEAGAKAGGFLQDAGLAVEYRARTRRVFGDPAGARQAALDACEIYREWGACAKVALITETFGLAG